MSILEKEVELAEKKKKRNKTKNRPYFKRSKEPYKPRLNPILVGSELKKRIGE